MRAGLISILQTMTPESSTVLKHSISEAGRRNHNQTTPLHVAATLLAAPANYLRQACIRSHPNSSHPLQTRALELCFSVALERLPSAQSEPAVTEPPVSNALMAALKRAQAHQRRGCPDQNQQPLLSVKVEIEQLIISILDDPSVSRVMREAGFSSPAVKAMIEQNLNSSGNTNSTSCSNVSINRNIYLGQRVRRNDENLYINPRLQQKSMSFGVSSGARSDDVKRVVEIMSKTRKRNPVLVGEFELELVKREILLGVRNGDFGFKDVDMVSMIPGKVSELIEVIEAKVLSNGRVIVDLGDLKWLVEQGSTDGGGVDVGREAVVEIGKLVTKCADENGKVWLIGGASRETYMKCQVYHPLIENDWDLHALPISSRSSFPGRSGPNGMFGSSLESLNSFRNLSTMMSNSPRMPPCCPKCYHEYEQELAKLKEVEKSALEAKSNLPQWMQNAKAQSGESESETEAKMPHQSHINDQELQKKWIDICSRIHPNHNQNQNPMFSRMMTCFVPTRLLSPCQSPTSQQRESPRSPVRTELFLGPQEVREHLPVKDFLGCISSEPQAKGKFVNSADTDSFKKLLKGLMKKAWWQPEAAYTVATTVQQCRSRGSVWLVFAGPDRVGKKKMALVLAEHVCGRDPITVCLGSRRDEDENRDMGTGFRGKTVLDRIVEVVRRNQDSVIVLSDIDEADMLVRGSIKRAMERGRLMDSHGRDISLGNIVFVLTGNWSTNNFDEMLEEKPGELRLKLAVCEKRSKRRADWLLDGNMSAKQQKKAGSVLSLDLNLTMDLEEDRTDTSDLTIEQADENVHFAITSLPQDLVGPNDGVVIFKPVQFGLIRHEIEKTVKNAFSYVTDSKLSIEVDEATLDNILSGIWFGRTSLEDWAEQVLFPSFHKLVEHLPSSAEDMVVRLESDRDLEQVNHDRGWLPSNINVMVDTVKKSRDEI